MDLPYLKAVLVVWTTLGLHLVEPFYAITIQEGATHGSLTAFYKGLCSSMAKPVDMESFSCARPMLDGVGQELFTSVTTARRWWRPRSPGPCSTRRR